MKRIFLTGATGTMGLQTMKCILDYPAELRLTVLARKSKKNIKLLSSAEKEKKIDIIWGDLENAEDVRRGVADADIVLHVGGMVSPAADHLPELTYRINTVAARNIVDGVKSRHDGGKGVKVVYIGSVAQTGYRHSPTHWGRTGDPVWASKFDMYALSKIEAERIIAESGLPYWVSLRQTGILARNLLNKGTDPITFHVPIDGVLEWITDEESGQLLCNLCLADIPDNFWKHFYNIGGGKGFRVTNYEFEKLILDATYCPKPEKIFDANWFATRNFHGQWYEDSDRLEELFHFRSYDNIKEYFNKFKNSLPGFFKLASIVPVPVIKFAMKQIAKNRKMGTLSWIAGNDPERFKAYFGSLEEWRNIPAWEDRDMSAPSSVPVRLSHGYDEDIPEEKISLKELREAAAFRGGKCLAEDFTPGNLDTPLEWECHAGHRFTATPRLVLLGGHWCKECFSADADYDSLALHNPFFAQVYP